MTASLLHLFAELERVDLLLRLHLRAALERKQTDDRFEGLRITDAEVEALARRPAGPPPWASDVRDDAAAARSLAALAERAEARAAKGLAEGERLRWAELSSAFRLESLDRHILLVALAAEVDLRYETLFAYLQDDVTRRRPSVDLVLNLACRTLPEKMAARARFSTSAPLLRHRLIRLVEEASRPEPSLLAMGVRIDERVAAFLLGDDTPDARIEPPPVALSPTKFEAPAALDERAGELLQTLPKGALVVLRGARGAGKKTAAAALCRRLGLGLLVADASALAGRPTAEVEEAARRVAREATLQRAVPYWDNLDALLESGRERACAALLDETARDRRLTFAAKALDDAPLPPCQAPCVAWDVPPPRYEERLALWGAALGPAADLVAPELPALASKFRLSPGSIVAAAQRARAALAPSSAAQPDASPSPARSGPAQPSAHASASQPSSHAGASPTSTHVQALHAACREQGGGRLDGLARRLEPRATLDDLVLPPASLQALRDLAESLPLRGVVHERWGFERKLHRGRGVSALFAGPPGTGKTLAAEALARHAGLDLYAIDLSAVVNKYIGETEKNLARIFSEAERGSAILFFDEADALFSRRVETSDAHDRYANLETSYLLQRMEAYEGASILATNLRKNLDDALFRRLSFAITFPFPEPPERLQLWQRAFPPEAPLAELDYPFLSERLKLSGGNIRNVAVAAAFLAAARNGPVTMEHVVVAAQRELQKMGMTCVAADFGEHGRWMRG